MRKSTFFIFITLFFFFGRIFFCPVLYGIQKSEWKGKIEFEDGIKVVKNPEAPLYGEITFDLEEDLIIGNENDENCFFYRVYSMAVDKQENIYILDGGNTRIQVYDKKGQYFRTIGRKGQGPGEFQSPQGVFFDDQNKKIYVPDFRSIKVFASNGDYLNTISLGSYNRSYYISSGGIIIGEVDKVVFDNNNKAGQRRYFASLRFINNKDGSETPIASYPDQGSKIIEGKTAKFWHGYEHMPYVVAISPQTFIYGFSADYELNIINSTGELLLKIHKESPQISISKKEKDTVREKYRNSPIKNVNNIPFPEHKPHYGYILADGNWIFVMGYKFPQDQSESVVIDIFNTQGYYLYKSTFPIRPLLVKNGFMYMIDSSDESGNIRIKRLKIKNWDQIKEEIE